MRASLVHELTLIGRLNYAPYFLTVNSIVRFARSRDILCQGRGSAANSAVCFVLGITAIDPARSDLLFERFVSEERREPPDIDVDFEHERREIVIQWIFETYGRDRAALCSTVIRYRTKGALRDVGKALGLPEDLIAQISGQVWGWSEGPVDQEHLKELNLNLSDRRLKMTLELAGALRGFPRHLSQHPGGFVLTNARLDDLVPIEPAAMAGRQVVEWDKDDIDSLKFMKVDVLALGMLSCMKRGLDLLKQHKAIDLDLATIPAEWRERASKTLCSEAGFGAGVSCCAGEIESFDPPVSLEVAMAWVERSALDVMKVAHIQLTDGHTRWFRRDGFARVEHREAAPRPGIVVEHESPPDAEGGPKTEVLRRTYGITR